MLDYVGGAFVAAAFAFVLYRIVRTGSLRGMLFGARVLEKVGEVPAEGGRVMSVTVRVHRLQPTERGAVVGLEIAATSFGSYQMTPASLTAEQASALAELLQRAATSAETPGP